MSVRRALPRPPFVYAVVDTAFLRGRPVGAVVKTITAEGVRLLQVRAKGEPDRVFLAVAEEAVEASRETDAIVLVNDRPDIAVLARADGVHLGQDDVTPTLARRLLGADALIGLSTHGEGELGRAVLEPIDYVAIGAVFPTSSKAKKDPVVGLEGVGKARLGTSLPLVAIGGIGTANAREVVKAGADGVAVISALLAADDLRTATRELLAAVGT